YTIMTDETREISNREQSVICIRWVDDYNVREDPIGLNEIPSQDAQTITNVLKDALTRCGTPLANCRGQAYDGGSNVSGKLNGVATKLKKEVPNAIYVHCLSHCLNFAVQGICKTQKTGSTENPNLIHEALAFMHEVAKLIRLSPKKHCILQEIKQNISTGEMPTRSNLQPLFPARWTIRANAINAVLQCYRDGILYATLQEICQDSSDSAATVLGLMYQMDAFDTYFSLKLAYLKFSASDHLATRLQSKNTITQDAILGVSTLCDYYSSRRQEECLDTFYHSVLEESKDITEETKLPSTGHIFYSLKKYYRQQYFEILELVHEKVDSHCGSEKYGIVQDIETLLLEACNGKSKQYDLDIEQLKIQLKMLPNFITAAKVIKKITTKRTLCDIFSENQMAQSIFIDVQKLLLLYLTIPATTATAEHTFSMLRCLKTYLRSTMNQDRLNNLLLLHVHKDLANKRKLQILLPQQINIKEQKQHD
uniref:HAT C-terminal dimerisation domain-containing protein n=1 Tax=Latimeria chalumnae TaxID=7897 RepID=H3AKX0_LATCH